MNDYTKRGVALQERSILGTPDKLYHKLSVLVYKVALVGLIALFALGGSLGLGAFKGILSSVPDIEGLSVTPRGYSTFVYDLEGNQIAKLVSTDSNRIPVSIDMIPQNLKDALLIRDTIKEKRWFHIKE